MLRPYDVLYVVTADGAQQKQQYPWGCNRDYKTRVQNMKSQANRPYRQLDEVGVSIPWITDWIRIHIDKTGSRPLSLCV